MKTCLAYIRRFFIFCMALFYTDYSYSGEYINGHEHDYLNQVFIDAREDDYKEMVNHYKLMIKKAEESSDTDTRDILLKEARALECAYENKNVFDPLSRTLQYIYIHPLLKNIFILERK